MAVELHLDVELLAPATVFFVQRFKSKLGETLMLVLSSFLRVPRVSTLVHGVAAAVVLLFVAGRLRLPCAAPPRALAPPGRSARRAAPRHRWPTSSPAEAARRAAGHGPVPWLS